MRRFGAFSLAAFYLLLTTGMFVCLAHCSAEYLFAKTGQEMAEHNESGVPGSISAAMMHNSHEMGKAHDHKKGCSKGKDCDCCKKHGRYVIKENIAGSPGLQLGALQVAEYWLPYQLHIPVPGMGLNKIFWLKVIGPPPVPDQPLYISNRSLLI